MNTARSIAILALGALAPFAACEKKSGAVAARTDSAAPVADNTANNKVDADGAARTPMDQSESGVAIKVTTAIRRAVMDDKALSLNAQNCKIVTDKSGVVTLRGVVNSQAEKDSVDAKAKAVAGVTRVDNQLEVKAK